MPGFEPGSRDSESLVLTVTPHALGNNQQAALVQLVRTSALHAEGPEFESRRLYTYM